LLKDLYDRFAVQESLLTEKKADQNREDAQLKLKEAEIREIKRVLIKISRWAMRLKCSIGKPP
jgi:hypothetical protein